MKIKLDKNIRPLGVAAFREAGFDAATTVEQGMNSASDATVADVCRNEARCLVTLDLDFANPLVYRPRDYRGIAVLRLPPKPSHEHLMSALATLLTHLQNATIDRRLGIVEIARVRLHQDEEFEIDGFFKDVPP